MKTSLHLVSAPWAMRFEPSIQMGCLKAYIDEKFDRKVEVHCHSAFLSIFYEFQKKLPSPVYDQLEDLGESIYMILFYEKFLKGQKGKKIALPKDFPGWGAFENLREATETFVATEIAPKLNKKNLNVVGFSLNFAQLYASLYLEKYLESKFKGYKFLFLYGGYGANSELTTRVLQKFDSRGFRVLGEGERKLELIMEKIVGASNVSGAVKDLAKIDGVVPVQKSSRQPDWSESKSHFESQIKDLSTLPLPDYSSFFELMNKYTFEDPFFAKAHRNITLPIEGTRGCFARCDFCALNAQWSGFRKTEAESVFKNVNTLKQKYGISEFLFVDNVCDTWGEKFADMVRAENFEATYFMELRAHHPEKFWTKLALAGLTRVQIGVEALGINLLKNMGKGTRVIQNLKVQKYLTELGVYSSTNLITFHPRSSLQDIKETREILEVLPHFPRFKLAHFMLFYGSPLYDSLPLKEKKNLEPYNLPFDPPLPRILRDCPMDVAYVLPPSLELSDELHKGWRRFTKWARTFYESAEVVNSKLSVTKISESESLIQDYRFGQKKTFKLKGLRARIYDLGHKGFKAGELLKLGSLTEAREELDWLCLNKLILKVEDFYLSVALRPKEELLENLNSLDVVSEFAPKPESLAITQ